QRLGSTRVRALAAVAGGSRAAVNRFEQDALRSTEGADRLQTPVANAVVNRSPRDAQHLCGVVQGNTASDTWLEPDFLHWGNQRHLCLRMPDIKARTVPPDGWTREMAAKSLPNLRLGWSGEGRFYIQR